jgi:hypothetical protein
MEFWPFFKKLVSEMLKVVNTLAVKNGTIDLSKKIVLRYLK